VRNGPAITLEGLRDNDVVDGVLPLMVNAYGKGDQKKFLIDGSESPRTIPSFFWAALLAFLAWAAFTSSRTGCCKAARLPHVLQTSNPMHEITERADINGWWTHFTPPSGPTTSWAPSSMPSFPPTPGRPTWPA
jgi:hypothetical protein